MASDVTSFELDKSTVVDYLAKFELVNSKIHKMQPILDFKIPEFKVTNNLSVEKTMIKSPFG